MTSQRKCAIYFSTGFGTQPSAHPTQRTIPRSSHLASQTGSRPSCRKKPASYFGNGYARGPFRVSARKVREIDQQGHEAVLGARQESPSSSTLLTVTRCSLKNWLQFPRSKQVERTVPVEAIVRIEEECQLHPRIVIPQSTEDLLQVGQRPPAFELANWIGVSSPALRQSDEATLTATLV